MSHRKTEPDEPTENSNVVVLQPAGGRTRKRSCAKGTQGAPAVVQISSESDSMTHDGLSLLRAFFAIEDVAARASLITLAQKLASHAPKR
jgi:hypothetical protein